MPRVATKEVAPPAEKPKDEAEKAQTLQEAQQKVAQAVSVAAMIGAQVMKAGGAQKYEAKEELARAAIDRIVEYGQNNGWSQQSLETTVRLGRILSSPLTEDGKQNARQFDYEYLERSLIMGDANAVRNGVPDPIMPVMELSDSTNVLPRVFVAGVMGESAIRQQEAEGKITKEKADALVLDLWRELGGIKTWDDYLRIMPDANKIIARSGSDFRMTDTVSLGFSASASNVPRVVGIQSRLSSGLASAALGGQIASAREKAGGAPAGPKLGMSEQSDEGGFLIIGGNAERAPTTREDAGRLDLALATVLAETLAEEKGRIGNTVAEAKARERRNQEA